MTRTVLAVIATLAVTLAACREEAPAPARFTHEIIDENTSRVTIPFDPNEPVVGAVMGNLGIIIHCALERGFRWVKLIDPCEQGMPADQPKTLEFFHHVPEGYEAVTFDVEAGTFPENLNSESEDIVLDAHAFDAYFSRKSPDWRDKLVKPPAIHVDPAPRVTAPRTLTRERFVELAAPVRTLTPFTTENETSPRLCIVTKAGVSIVDAKGEVERSLAIAPPFGVVPLMGKAGIEGYISHRWNIIRYDTEGRELWRFPNDAGDGGRKAPSALSLASGDLDGDGDREHVVGCNGKGGVFVLDDEGHTLTYNDAVNVHSVAVVDLFGDTALEIVHVNGSTDGAVVRNAEGYHVDVASTLSSTFETATSPSGEPLFVTEVAGKVRILDRQLQELYVRKLAATGVDNVQIAWLPWTDGDEPWMALSRTIGYTDNRSEVYVFDPAGNLAWHEEFASSYAPIAAFGAPDSNAAALLVGVGHEVWAYAPVN